MVDLVALVMSKVALRLEKCEHHCSKASLLHSNSCNVNMRAKYCCDSQAYQNYYLNQVGHGLPHFSGARYLQAYDLGNIFSSIAKIVLPLVKNGAKAIGKQVLHSEVCFCSDVLSGKNVKQTAIDCAKSAVSNS